MNHCMVDIETLDTKPSAVVLSIGAVFFSPAWQDYEPVLNQTFYGICSVPSQPRRSRSQDTLDWWEKQSTDAKALLVSTASTQAPTLKETLTEFASFLRKHEDGKTAVYGNGATFDNVILRHAFEQEGLDCPWPFWMDRCHMTLTGLGIQSQVFTNKREGTHHNALDDAKYQARAASIILGRVEGLKG